MKHTDKSHKSLILTMAVTIILGFTACKEQLPNMKEEIFHPAYQKLLSMGFEANDIQGYGTFYLVEGDIAFDKEKHSMLNARSQKAFDGNDNGLIDDRISLNNHLNMTVKIDASIPTSGSNSWYNAIVQGINEWNFLIKTSIHFTLTTSSNADIVIEAYDPMNPPIHESGRPITDLEGLGSWPSNGQPGDKIIIWLPPHSNITHTASSKVQLIVHELGHCLGLAHTDSNVSLQIPGTPTSDNSSVMKSASAGNPFYGFTSGDHDAIAYLYPYLLDQYLVGKQNGKAYLIGRKNNLFQHDTDMDGETESTQTFGSNPSTQQYFSADWNGNGNSSLAYRSGSTFYIDTDGNGSIDNTITMSATGANEFFTGDWNGSGSETVAYRVGSHFYFDNDGNGTIDQNYQLIGSGSAHQFIVGDWNGNGTTTLGYRIGKNSYLDADGNGTTDMNYNLGKGFAASHFIPGDWNNNGTSTMTLQVAQLFMVDENGNGVQNYSIMYGWGD